MKILRKLWSVLLASTLLFSCQEGVVEEAFTPTDYTQKVTLSVAMDETRAAIDGTTGAFTWQEGDKISVLTTDNKFFTFTLKGEPGTKEATFEGAITEGAKVAGVAIHPAVVKDGAENTIYNADTGVLTYPLAPEWTYAEGQTNVPMVATVAEGAEKIAFRQVGGVVRFPVSYVPKGSKVVLTATGIRIAGDFAFNVAGLGTDAIVAEAAEGTTSTVTVNFEADTTNEGAEINLPVATGNYTAFSVDVIDATGTTIKHKDYTVAKEIKRATLLVMNTLDTEVLTVYPFFTDARVIWSPVEGVSQYAIFIDDATEPTIIDADKAEVLESGRLATLVGTFKHGSNHQVAVAHVVDGKIVASSKTPYVNFTTGRVMQVTNNTGTRFICAGWDDVAIGVENSTSYDPATKTWSVCTKTLDDIQDRNLRGYRVQLYAADKTTVIYDEIPFSSQVDYGASYASSSWLGKVNNKNFLIPTALSFGWLEPGTKYYFRVKTLDEAVKFNLTNTPNNAWDGKEYSVSSARGGCGWSEFVEMTTDAAYVMGANDIFHEGFDDMLFNSDIANAAPALVPQVLTSKTSASNYENRKSAAKYDDWLALPAAKRTFSEQAFSKMLHVYEHGLTDDDYTDESTPRTLNAKAGSLEGWQIISPSKDRHLYPNFGAIRLGQSGSSSNGAELRTTPITSDILDENKATKVIVTIKASCSATTVTIIPSNYTVFLIREDAYGEIAADQQNIEMRDDATWSSYFTGTPATSDATDYAHGVNQWHEAKFTFYMKKGDRLSIKSHTKSSKGMLLLGDIKIEKDPTDDGSGAAGARFFGTAPDNTNYDVWGLDGRFPTTFWMGPPALDQNALHTLDAATLATYKTTYFDPIVAAGYNLIEFSNPFPESIHILMQWCADAGVRFLDKSNNSYTADGTVMGQIMERFSSYINTPLGQSTYAGAFVGPDEPGAATFGLYGYLANVYKAYFPTKARTVNLFPSYASECQLNCGNGGCTGSHPHPTFEAYVRNFVEVVPDVNCMMYDHYCLSKSDKKGAVKWGNVKSKQYYDLDLFRAISLEKRIPFLMITHGRPQWDKGWSATIANTDPACNTDVSATALPEMTDAMVYDSQRWLVWSQIAMGSKGASYFCYWTPSGFKGGPFSFHIDGSKTRMYDILSDINREIQPIGSILMKCHADGAIMTNPNGNFSMYQNGGNGLTNYGPVLEVARGNVEDVLVGCFRDASTGEYKVLVTHKAPANDETTTATPSIARLTLDTAMVSTVKLHTVTLSAGHNEQATTVVTEQTIENGKLELTIPDGTAVLVEFPETANKSYN